MDRRQNVRRPARFPAVLSLLDGPQTEFEAMVENLSGCGACVSLDAPLEVGAPVKLVFEDCILLGEVSYCSLEEGRHVAGLHLEQSLSHVSSLRKLMEALIEEPSGDRAQRRSGDRERRS